MQIFGIELTDILSYSPYILSALCFILTILLHRRISTTGTVMLVMAGFLFVISGVVSQLSFNYSEELSLGSYIMATFLLFMVMKESSGLSWYLLLLTLVLSIASIGYEGYRYIVGEIAPYKPSAPSVPPSYKPSAPSVSISSAPSVSSISIVPPPTPPPLPPMKPPVKIEKKITEKITVSKPIEPSNVSIYEEKYKQVPPKNFIGIRPRVSSKQYISNSSRSLFGESSKVTKRFAPVSTELEVEDIVPVSRNVEFKGISF